MKPFRSTKLLLILLGVSISVFGQKPDAPDGTIFVGRNFSFGLKEPAIHVLADGLFPEMILGGR